MEKEFRNIVALSIILFGILMYYLAYPVIYSIIKRIKHRRRLANVITNTDYREKFDEVYRELRNNDISKVYTEKMCNFLKELLIFIPSVLLFCQLSILVLNFINIFTKNSKLEMLKEIDFFGFIIFILILAVVVLMRYPIKNIYYKNNIIKKMICSINHNIKYIGNLTKLEEKQIIGEIYYGYHFINTRRKRFAKERVLVTDYIEYLINNETSVKMCDLHLQDYIEWSEGEESYDVFEGIIAKISRPKSVASTILIGKNKKKWCVNNSKDNFDEVFNIVTSDIQLIDVVLNEYVKQEIMNIYIEYGIEFEVFLTGNDVYIRFYTGKMFEDSMFNNVLGKKKLYRDYAVFSNVLEIVNRINEIL